MKFTQIVTGTWGKSSEGMNHSVYGLGEDGQVYKFFKDSGWVMMKAGYNQSDSKSKQRSNRVTDDDVPF